jgi:thioredoxin reductase (NADPH)
MEFATPNPAAQPPGPLTPGEPARPARPARPTQAAPFTPEGPGPARRVDALVIGAGPVGLFQVFQLGLLELGAELVDSLSQVGGQCQALYADKPIYDIPGIPVCTGAELVERLTQQIAPFKPAVHLAQIVNGVQRREDGRFTVLTDAGTEFDAAVVIIAGGVGAFAPRQLRLPEADGLLGRGLQYRLEDPASLRGKQVVVAGGGDSALETLFALAALPVVDRPARLTLLNRREGLRASDEHQLRLRALTERGQVEFVVGNLAALEVDPQVSGGHLASLQVEPPDGPAVRLPCERLVVRYGLSPRLGPLAHWGLDLERKQLKVDTSGFETSAPGIFAVGDINTYPGKKRLIVCGFHEATLAAHAAAARLRPGTPPPLQYTTTSPRLHRLLGVAPTE